MTAVTAVTQCIFCSTNHPAGKHISSAKIEFALLLEIAQKWYKRRIRSIIMEKQ